MTRWNWLILCELSNPDFLSKWQILPSGIDDDKLPCKCNSQRAASVTVSLWVHSGRLVGTASSHLTSGLVPDINSAWHFFHRNLLSLIHRSIPSRLQSSHPYSCPWYTEFHGEAIALKQLAFSSWKSNLTKDNFGSFHKAHNKCLSSLMRARKHICPTSILTFQTCLPPIKCGGALLICLWSMLPLHPFPLFN